MQVQKDFIFVQTQELNVTHDQNYNINHLKVGRKLTFTPSIFYVTDLVGNDSTDTLNQVPAPHLFLFQ